MGTRNLTVVILGGKHVVAQYGQWDGGPKGQGLTCLKFCNEILTNQFKKENFIKKLGQVSFYTEQELEHLNNNEISPHNNRNIAAKILYEINNLSDDTRIKLVDSYEFAADSLFCEWGYVIDLDNMTLECYKGFQKKPIPEGQRFSYLQTVENPNTNKYYQIRCVRIFSILDLPNSDIFCQLLESENIENV